MARLAGRLYFAAAVVILLAAAPPALAKPHFHLLGVGDGPAITDGQRYVAFLHHAPSAIYYDFGGESPYWRNLGAPACPHPELAAVGAGTLAWDCATNLPLVENLASGQLSSPLSSNVEVQGADGFQVTAIGSHWLAAMVTYPHVHTIAYYSLATGSSEAEPPSASQVADLGNDSLARTMCAPLSRSRALDDYTYEVGPAYTPYFYEAPYGVGLQEVAGKNGTIAGERITVQRCGSTRVSVISRCPLGCTQLGYSAGVVTWADQHALRAYAIRSRKRFTWPLGSFRADLGKTPASPQVSLIHTRQRLIASIPPPAGGHEWVIWAAALPRR